MADEQIRIRLTERRADAVQRAAALGAELDRFLESVPDANDDEHDPEGPTLAFERAAAQALLDDARRQVTDLDRALARVEEGTYGWCERCGGPIGAGRLEARPGAERCIDCAR